MLSGKPEKPYVRIVHLFKNEKDIPPNQTPRRIMMPTWGDGIILASTYYGQRKTLCGRRGGFLFVFTTEQLEELPLNLNQERMCKSCMRNADAALRLLSII